MKKHRIIIYSLTALAVISGGVAKHSFDQTSQTADNISQSIASKPATNEPTTITSAQCVGLDEIWKHVYSGDPRKFSKPQDRLQVIEPCKTVTGTIINAVAEKDGDWHIRLDVTDKSLLNAKNISGQKGYLVLEPVCSNPVTQRDTLQEGACSGYSQNVFDPSMIGKTVEVTGAYVTDQEHGWRELHPILSITVIK